MQVETAEQGHCTHWQDQEQQPDKQERCGLAQALSQWTRLCHRGGDSEREVKDAKDGRDREDPRTGWRVTANEGEDSKPSGKGNDENGEEAPSVVPLFTSGAAPPPRARVMPQNAKPTSRAKWRASTRSVLRLTTKLSSRDR